MRDGNIFFLVLNRPDNTINSQVIKSLNEKLDIVSNSEGPVVLVTMGTGSKVFSTGFDLTHWKADVTNSFETSATMLTVFKKLITLNVPTLCLMNGHSYAGGLFLGLCHDFRIIAAKAKICFTEITVGVGMSPAYTALATNLLDSQVARQLTLG